MTIMKEKTKWCGGLGAEPCLWQSSSSKLAPVAGASLRQGGSRLKRKTSKVEAGKNECTGDVGDRQGSKDSSDWGRINLGLDQQPQHRPGETCLARRTYLASDFSAKHP